MLESVVCGFQTLDPSGQGGRQTAFFVLPSALTAADSVFARLTEACVGTSMIVP